MICKYDNNSTESSILLCISALIFISLSQIPNSNGQTITGNLTLHVSQPIKLEGFNGLKTYSISSTIIDEKGNFKLNYSKPDYGVGYLKSPNEKPLFVILSGENIELVGEALSYPSTIKITKGQENQWLEQYAQEHPKREQALSAWVYLEKIYNSEPLFYREKKIASHINQEIKRLKKEDSTFLSDLPKESYVSWFLPTRKLVSSTSVVTRYRPEEIPANIAAFRKIDYSDQRLYKSGLFKDAIENHFWLLENSGKSLDSIFMEMHLSIDAMLHHLINEEEKLNEVAEFLFDLLEQHSLFRASEYLAIKMLNQTSCTINRDLAKQLETYRAMRKGNTAPDIDFANFPSQNVIHKKTTVKKLSEIQSQYTLVVFGAGWCPKCSKDIPEIIIHYDNWKRLGLEVVLISLDENEDDFKKFTEPLSFISLCDYKKWNGKTVEEYYVFGTPTMYLLNSKREIVLRPNFVEQINAWVDWFLLKGNAVPGR
jgi:peroxiredoxin